MKKFLAIIAVISAVLMLTMGVSAAGNAVEGRKTYKVYVDDNFTITKNGTTINDSWQYVPEIKLELLKPVSSYAGDDSKVAGEDYAKATVKVMWNGSDELYILYTVYDFTIALNDINPGGKDSMYWQYQIDNSTSKDAAIVAEPTNGGLLPHKAYTDDVMNAEGSSLGMMNIVIDGKNGVYTMERAIKVNGLEAEKYIGMEFQVNDDAEGNGVLNACLGWASDEDIRTTNNASKFGQLLFKNIKAENAASDVDTPDSSEPVADSGNANESGSTPSGTSPDTSDAASVAVLAVCAATAAVIVAKKRRK